LFLFNEKKWVKRREDLLTSNVLILFIFLNLFWSKSECLIHQLKKKSLGDSTMQYVMKI